MVEPSGPAAVGEQERLGEDLHRRDDLHEEQQGEDEPGLRDGDVPDLAQQSGAVEFGRLVQLARDALEGGQVDQGGAAHVHPGRRDDDREHGGVGVLEPLLGGQVEDVQDAVEESVSWVVEVLEEQHGGDRRQHHREVDQQAQIALPVPELVEHDGDDERDDEPEQQGQHGEQQGVAPGLPERGVVEDVGQVGPVGPGGLAVLGLLERQDEFPDHRIPGEEREAEHRSDQEAVCGDVAAHGAQEVLAGGVPAGGA